MDSQQVQFLAQEIAVAIDQGIKAGAESQPTLRDRFAMAALQGLLTDNVSYEGRGYQPMADQAPEKVAEYAYSLADAMLKARASTSGVKP